MSQPLSYLLWSSGPETCPQCPRLQVLKEAPLLGLKWRRWNHTLLIWSGDKGRVEETNRQQLSPKKFSINFSSSPSPSPVYILDLAEGFKKRRSGLRSVSHSHWHPSYRHIIGPSVKMKPEESNFNIVFCNIPKSWESEASILDRVKVVNPTQSLQRKSYLALPLRNAVCIFRSYILKAILSARGLIFFLGWTWISFLPCYTKFCWSTFSRLNSCFIKISYLCQTLRTSVRRSLLGFLIPSWRSKIQKMIFLKKILNSYPANL